MERVVAAMPCGVVVGGRHSRRSEVRVDHRRPDLVHLVRNLRVEIGVVVQTSLLHCAKVEGFLPSALPGVARADPAGSDGSTQQRQNYDSKPFVGPKLSSLGGMELVYALKLVLRRGT